MSSAALAGLSHEQLVARVRHTVDLSSHYLADRRVSPARIAVYPKRRRPDQVASAARRPLPVGPVETTAIVTELSAGPCYADFFARDHAERATA